MKLFPWLLLHPNIPKPLHNLAPRIILGDQWWFQIKSESKQKFNQCCWTCGVHKTEAKYHHWLEAHECYSLNYSTGKVEYVGTCALCHSCHNFIHDGRMQMILGQDFKTSKYFDIIDHGNRILSKWLGEKREFKSIFQGYNYFDLPQEIRDIVTQSTKKIEWINGICNWEDYHLIINGDRYERNFNSFKDWQNHKF